MGKEDTIIIDGFSFSDKDAIEVAKKEESAVSYLRAQVDFKRPEAVLSVYQKLVHQKVFHTVIGLSFLKELQTKLMSERQVPNTLIDPIDGDPMVIKKQEEEEPAGKKKVKKKKEKSSGDEYAGYRGKFIASLVVNIILVITIGGMFFLAFTSNAPNILNYRTNLENEYASWEDQLTQREKEVARREEALAESTQTNDVYNN